MVVRNLVICQFPLKLSGMSIMTLYNVSHILKHRLKESKRKCYLGKIQKTSHWVIMSSHWVIMSCFIAMNTHFLRNEARKLFRKLFIKQNITGKFAELFIIVGRNERFSLMWKTTFHTIGSSL